MSTKFAKVIDFVKDHMTVKLALFADLHTRVAQHKTTLDGRATMLASTRTRLVKDSGTVIAGTGAVGGGGGGGALKGAGSKAVEDGRSGEGTGISAGDA